MENNRLFKIQIFAVLLIDNLMAAISQNRSNCRGVVFFDKYYRREKLFGSFSQPKNLVIPQHSNDLFFSYMNWSYQDPGPGLRIKVCDLYKKHCDDIKKVYDGQAIAYDQRAKIVYFGGFGIYRYNSSTKSGVKMSKRDKVSHIFLRNRFFIIDNDKLFVLNNGSFTEVPEVKGVQVQNFFVSKNRSIYFINTTGLYKVDRPGLEIHLLSDAIKVTQIVEDYVNGGVFFSTSDGIYIDDVSGRKVRKVANIKLVFGLVFWHNDSKPKERNVIYSSFHGLYLLKPSNNSEYCLQRQIHNVSQQVPPQ